MNPARDSPHPEQFGPYEVYERLGMGGMASVYRAKKRGPAGFERTVALKRMLSHLTEDRGFIESFVREAKVASSLVHPNIAQVYDFGRIGGVFYIAMELVAGFDLRKMLRYANRSNEPIPLPVVLSILGEMCDALEYAHSFVDDTGQPLNIVHRDVSPSNIIVAHTGHAKVIDFGIAKASSRQLHTESGLVKGKLGYMAPEAAMGLQVGPASDVFSVGVVAWELVTALPLFSSRTDFETMRRLREEQVPPPSKHNTACPPELDALILAALARDVDKRVTSARAFRAGLDNIAAQYNIQASARVVAEWMKHLTIDATGRAPTIADSSRPRSPSGRVVPPPTEAQTSISRPVRVGTRPPPLRRSSDDIQLATEIWGEDATQHPDAAGGPDFSVMAHDVLDQGIAGKLAQAHVYTPPPYNTGVPSLAQKSPSQPVAVPPQAPSGSHAQYSAQSPSSGGYPQLGAPSSPSMPHAHTGARPTKSRKIPLVALAVLVTLAGVLAAVLVTKRAHPTPTANASLVFMTEPAGSIVEIGGKAVGSGSPLETRLAPGVYSIAVRHDGYRTWTGSITLRDGERQPINIALEKSIVAVTEIAPTGEKIAPNPTDAADSSNAGTKVTAHDRGRQPDKSFHVVESPRVESPRPDATKVDANKRATNKGESNKADPNKADPNKADPNKADLTKDPTKIDPSKDPTKVDPTPSKDPNKVTTKPIDDTKLEPLVDSKPARTPVVAASAVSKLSGDVPVLRGSSGSGDVLAKMCIDESGKVTSVKIVKSPPEIAVDLQRALTGWRYAPYKNKDSKVSPVCFPLTLRVVLRN